MIKIILGIDGMICGMCETHINNEVRNNFNIQKVTSSHTKKQTVIITNEDIDEQNLRDVISSTGYTVTSYKSEPYEKKGLFGFGKRKLRLLDNWR